MLSNQDTRAPRRTIVARSATVNRAPIDRRTRGQRRATPPGGGDPGLIADPADELQSARRSIRAHGYHLRPAHRAEFAI